MSQTSIPMDNEKMASILEATQNYRILRRFDPESLKIKGELPPTAERFGILDTETTGTGQDSRIIELGLVVVAYDALSGEIFGLEHAYSGLEDPGIPIPPEASAVNGITDEMVAGKKIDDELVQSLCQNLDFIIAHNAGFDRGIAEGRFPFLTQMKWGCSYRQVPWSQAGINGGKLDYIAMCLGFYYDAHRAEVDCMAVAYALKKPLPGLDGQTGFELLLENMEKKSYRVWATGAPFDVKDILKAAGYRWHDGSQPGTEKAWMKEVSDEDLQSELTWLKANGYYGRPSAARVDEISALDRFTNRYSSTTRKAL
ncbi:hypothetical protein LC612_30455 [Nostoc sp. CHAB 5834]|nr:hypothetical protein [Nostoc sp. CHAB 5834]